MTDYATPFLPQIRQKIEEWEGGYVNDPNDAGGETHYGIALNRTDMTREELFELDEDTAWSYLFQNYGSPFHITNMSPGLALLVLDGAINQGLRGTTHRLQKIINLKFLYPNRQKLLIVDGHYGTRSESALYKCLNLNKKYTYSHLDFLSAFAALRMRHYAKITANNPTFIKGWSNRLMDVMTQAIAWDTVWLADLEKVKLFEEHRAIKIA